MISRIDISFFDIFSDKTNIPSINLTNENFYILFCIFNSTTNEPIIDETIYYPVATFNDEEYKQEKLEIKAERCKMDHIPNKYKQYYEEYNLENYYCLEDVNKTLMAYLNSFYVKIFPCKNNSENNNHCKSKEIIETTINESYFSFETADIIITPEDFENPVVFRSNYFYVYMFRNVGQYLYLKMELVNIETDNNIIGFDFFTDIKSENFMKIDDYLLVPRPGYDLYNEENDLSICEFEIQLTDKMLIEKRSYSKLIDVLGEVGGLMEIISMVFNFFSSIIVDILYENSVVKNLFSFDLKNKQIFIKNNGNNFDNEIYKDKQDKNKFKELKELFSEGHELYLKKNHSKNSFNLKTNYKNIDNLNTEGKNDKLEMIFNIDSDKDSKNNFEKHSAFSKMKKNKKIQKKEKSNYLINNIKINYFLIHFCFCCIRKKNNINNILLEEAMNLLIEKLDLFYLFKFVNKSEKSFIYFKDAEIIETTDKSINNPKKIKRKMFS